MNWQRKATIFRLLDAAPFGKDLHYLLQKHVTRSVPRRITDYPRYTQESMAQLEIFRTKIGPNHKLYFEFGAGWDLFHNLLLYCHGVERQLLVDLTEYMRPELVNGVIRNFQEHPPEGAMRLPEKQLAGNPKEQLQEFYGINYLAPADARSVPIPTGSVDLAGTTNTLEHIPFEELERIMRELRRLCTSDALIAMQIDYSDHYAHSDSAITPYNFLRFSDPQWKQYNLPSHYQNRRRHTDYRKLFLETGFSIESETEQRPPDWERLLASVPLHASFKSYEPEVLAITSGVFSLRPV